MVKPVITGSLRQQVLCADRDAAWTVLYTVGDGLTVCTDNIHTLHCPAAGTALYSVTCDNHAKYAQYCNLCAVTQTL
jgi:hypothetical protein